MPLAGVVAPEHLAALAGWGFPPGVEDHALCLAEGGQAALQIPLRELPAQLAIGGADILGGAQDRDDGRDLDLR